MQNEKSILFKKLAVEIAKTGKIEEYKTDNEELRVFNISEFSFILSRQMGILLPTGIMFEVFKNSFILTPDGEVIFQDVDLNNVYSDESIYKLDEPDILKAVESYLHWRINVLQRSKV